MLKYEKKNVYLRIDPNFTVLCIYSFHYSDSDDYEDDEYLLVGVSLCLRKYVYMYLEMYA